jgi:hypothetical protein
VTLANEITQVVLEVLGDPDFTKAIALNYPNASAYDVETQTATKAIATVNIRAIVEDFPLKGRHVPESAMSGMDYGQGVVVSNSKKITIAAANIPEPLPTCTVTYDGKTLSVIGVETVFVGDTAVLYILRAGAT